MDSSFSIRPARPEEYPRLGQLLVDAYARLPGMPGPGEQPEYYATLADIGRRAGNPAITVFAAVDGSGEVLGSVDFIEDPRQYGSGGAVGHLAGAAGIRLLAVGPAARGKGLGKALTRFCIDRARELGRTSVILHTTKAMQVAWAMYEQLGFERFPDIDFQQGRLEVFGFRLRLGTGGARPPGNARS